MGSQRVRHDWAIKPSTQIHWKDQCWDWSTNIFATWCEETTHWKRPWCWERLKAQGGRSCREWESITDSMDVNLNKFWKIVKDRGAWHASVHGVPKSWAWFNDWTTTERTIDHILTAPLTSWRFWARCSASLSLTFLTYYLGIKYPSLLGLGAWIKIYKESNEHSRYLPFNRLLNKITLGIIVIICYLILQERGIDHQLFL